ncbi:hypothetical protein AB0I51_36035 [Streptomyces sp. NPDC050549]|uniref:hypothetical protein n=1 Tax=Streptomyces sp. NPDC050549 TaxID=3155406 RepID=UPI00343F1443
MLSHAMNRRAFLNGTLTVAATAAIAGTTTGADATDRDTSATPPTGPLRIDTGRVSGVASLVSGVTVFKGLPYAATTVGANGARRSGPSPGRACGSRTPSGTSARSRRWVRPRSR